MALFLTPIPEPVLQELEKRAAILGDTASGKKVDLTQRLGGTGEKWKFARQSFVRAASLAVLRPTYTEEFLDAVRRSDKKFDKVLEEYEGQAYIDHPMKNNHRLKNVLFGGFLQDKGSNNPLDPTRYSNLLDDHARYDQGIAGFGKNKLEGYKSIKNSEQIVGSTPNSRPGVPNPGIISLDVENVGSFGSMKKIDMEVECHDFAQLQMIESLYMTPGTTIILEFGWSVDTKGKDVLKQLINLTDESKLKNTTDLHTSLLNKSKTASFAYEGAIGTVTNYTWSAKENGSFTCKISLRSRGEAFLGQQVDAEHSPLAKCLGSLTTRYIKNGLSDDVKDKLGDKKDAFESTLLDANRAQEYLNAQLTTIPNTYYPSVNTKIIGVRGGVKGIDDPLKSFSDLDFAGLEEGNPEKAGSFPRFFYKYKQTQANQQRQQLRDKAKNSVNQGNKQKKQQKNAMKNMARDTIKEYVATIIAPAIFDNQRTKGIQNGYVNDSKFDVNYDPSLTRGGPISEKGFRKITMAIENVQYGLMPGPGWGTNGVYDATNIDLGNHSRKNVYGFFSPDPTPWGNQTMAFAYTKKQTGLTDTSPLRWRGIPTPVADATVTHVYRPFFDINKRQSKQTDALLFGCYFPWGKGGDWSGNWSSALSIPFNPFRPTAAGLQNSFWQYYNQIHIPHWVERSGGGASITANKTGTKGWKSINDATCPLSNVVARTFIGYSKGKSKNRSAMEWVQMQGGDLRYISAGSVMNVLGKTIQNACKASGKPATLSMENLGSSAIKFVKEGFNGRVPDASNVQKFIAGEVPGLSSNVFTSRTSTTTAQTVWTELACAVGQGQKNDSATQASYGLPHKYTRGNVGRAMGSIHVTHPLYAHVLSYSGINMMGLTTKAQYGTSASEFGLYYNTSKVSGVANSRFEISGRDQTNKIKPRLRRLDSGHPSQLMDYPMPMWGHYQELERDGSFKFVDDIEKNKKKFKSAIRESQKNAELAMNQAFADAYAIFEEHRMITDGDVFIPFAVLEKIINDCSALEKDEELVTRFDSGQHALAGDGKLPEGCDPMIGKTSIPGNSSPDINQFVKMINDYNDTGFQIDPFTLSQGEEEDGEVVGGGLATSTVTVYPGGATAGIQPIKSRISQHNAELAKILGGEVQPAEESTAMEFGFGDHSFDHATYFQMDSFMMSQIVSLPSKICNHKYLCSTDPRVCILPGQTGVHVFEDSPMDENDYENAPKYIGDDAENSKLEGLKYFKRFTDDPLRQYGYLSNILVNCSFILEMFDKSSTLKDMMQKVLDGMSAACGDIWNFKFQIDGANDSGTTRIVDANFSNAHLDVCAEFPVMRTDSMVRNYSLESKIPNAMAVMALYGNNTPNPDGQMENKLFELGNMFVDLAHENIQLPQGENESQAASDEEQTVPRSVDGRVQALVLLLSNHIHDNLKEEHVTKAGNILRSILHDRSAHGPGENALLDHNIIPLKMSFEIDGMSGIHFGHALTASHLPQRYKDNVCFQVTNVKHSIRVGQWTTSIEAIMRRRPIEMGVYRIGSASDGVYDPTNLRRLTKDKLKFTRNAISWDLGDTAQQVADIEEKQSQGSSTYINTILSNLKTEGGKE